MQALAVPAPGQGGGQGGGQGRQLAAVGSPSGCCIGSGLVCEALIWLQLGLDPSDAESRSRDVAVGMRAAAMRDVLLPLVSEEEGHGWGYGRGRRSGGWTDAESRTKHAADADTDAPSQASGRRDGEGEEMQQQMRYDQAHDTAKNWTGSVAPPLAPAPLMLPLAVIRLDVGGTLMASVRT